MDRLYTITEPGDSSAGINFLYKIDDIKFIGLAYIWENDGYNSVIQVSMPEEYATFMQLSIPGASIKKVINSV